MESQYHISGTGSRVKIIWVSSSDFASDGFLSHGHSVTASSLNRAC